MEKAIKVRTVLASISLAKWVVIILAVFFVLFALMGVTLFVFSVFLNHQQAKADGREQSLCESIRETLG